MKHKDTIYAGRKLSTELINPANGEVVIPAHRKLTKRLIEKAESLGLSVTADMLHDHKKERAKKRKAEMIARQWYLEAKIDQLECELNELKIVMRRNGIKVA